MANFQYFSKVTLPNNTEADIRDRSSMHWLGKTTTELTDQATTSSIVVGSVTYSTVTTTETATAQKLRANDYVTYGTDNLGFIFDGTKWNLLSEAAASIPVSDVQVDGTSVVGSTVAGINTTGSYDGDSTSQTYNPVATKTYVDNAISNLPEPMVFKGTVGAQADNPTITALPVDGSAKVGDTYKVITDGVYASTTATVGDIFICLTKTSSANTWSYIPSGDEPSGTVTNVAAGVGLTTADGNPITESGTIKANLASETALTGDDVASVGVDGSGKLAVKIREVDGTYNASTNKVATQSTVTNAIAALDGGTIGTPGAGKTVTALSQTDGNVSATFSDIEITVSQVSDVTATTTIHNPTKATVVTTVGTAAASSTAATGAIAYCAYDSSTESMTLNQITVATGDSITTTDVANVVVATASQG